MSEPQIANVEQATLLLDTDLGDLLARLSEGPVGAAQLAGLLGQPLSSVHARLQRLLRAGVIEQVSVRKRAGRPVREYLLHTPWSIPFEVTPAATLRELLGSAFQARLNEHLDSLAAFMTRLEGEWVIEVTGQGGHWGHVFKQQDKFKGVPRPIFGQGTELRLNNNQARELGKRLEALIEEFGTQPTAQPSSDTSNWSFTALLTPERN
jgi:hypothetical protein